MRCGKCWGDGHVGNRCTAKVLNPATLPYWNDKSRNAPVATNHTKPHQELLLKPCPLAAPTMPSNRPKRLTSFIDGDLEFTTEVSRLSNSVIFDTHGKELNFKLDDVAGFATRTRLVDNHEISVGRLSSGRFLINLPPGLAVETFINATSLSLWDAGFSFQHWSPMDGATLAVPEFKVLLTLDGVQPHLHKESIISKAISTFGTFLCSVPQAENDGLVISQYTVVVAVDRLERVPIELELNVRGCAFILTVHTKNWMRAPLYSAAELPKHLPIYSRPVRQVILSGDDGELIHVSRRFLRDLCKDVDPISLPEEVQRILKGTTDRREITMAQSETVINILTANAQEQPVQMDHDAGQMTHVEGLNQENPHLATEVSPHSLNSVETREAETFGVANFFSTNSNPVATVVHDTMPQKIKPQIQILRRSPKKNLEAAMAQNVRTTVGGQDQSGVQCSRSDDRCQLENTDKTMAVKGKARLLPVGTQVGDKPGPSKPKVPQPKPKKIPNRPAKVHPKMGRLINLQVPPKQNSFKHTNRPKQTRQKELNSRAEINLNPSGFFEVAVQYDMCSELGMGCGLRPGDISRALHEDNLQRGEAALNNTQGVNSSQDQEGPTLDFDSDEDLLSGEEAE